MLFVRPDEGAGFSTTRYVAQAGSAEETGGAMSSRRSRPRVEQTGGNPLTAEKRGVRHRRTDGGAAALDCLADVTARRASRAMRSPSALPQPAPVKPKITW